MILLRKKKLVLRSLVAQGGGEIKTDRIALPDNALCVTGIKAVGRHLQVSDPEVVVNKQHYIYGADETPDMTPDILMELNLGEYKDLSPQFTVSAPTGSGKYIYFAHPTSLSYPVFVYENFQGGFLNQGTVSITGPDGVQQFRVWRSVHPNLGDNVIITANHQ